MTRLPKPDYINAPVWAVVLLECLGVAIAIVVVAGWLLNP